MALLIHAFPYSFHWSRVIISFPAIMRTTPTTFDKPPTYSTGSKLLNLNYRRITRQSTYHTSGQITDPPPRHVMLPLCKMSMSQNRNIHS